MINKRGFTLAEVLITLGIIGVIAAMTVPTLMNNSTELEFRSAFKKGLASLNQAVTMNVALDNVDFDSLIDTSVDDTTVDSLYALLSNRMTTAKFLETGSVEKDAADLDLGKVTDIAGKNVAMFFTDGSALIWNPNELAPTDADDNPGIKVVWDVNGAKKPNRLSWCDSAATGNKKPDKRTLQTVEQRVDSAVGCTDDNIVVRDQFSIRLNGNRALPNGPAAYYLFYKK